MAAGRIVHPSYFPARDRNNRLVSGALMAVRQNLSSSVLASVYSDQALTTPLTNPVAANSSGQFPDVWCDAGTTETPVLYTLAFGGPDGESIGNPAVFDNWQPSIDGETASQALAEAAADSAQAYYEDILALAGEYPDPAALATRAEKAANGSDFADKEEVTQNLLFLQAGTGAEERSLRAKGRDIVNVADFGAVGDGVTNDTAAVNAALASLTAGGVLHFQNGKAYKIAQGTGSLPADTIVADDIAIEGNGATIVGYPATGVVANSSYNQFYNVFQATNRTGLRIRNLKNTGALSLAALYGCSNVRIDNVEDDGALAQGLTNVLTITGITQAAPGTVTYTGTDPADGDYYTLTGIVGMTQLNDKVIRITSVNTGANTFTLRDIDGNALDTSGYTAYSSGGSAALCSNWLRDKSIYLKECDDVVVNGATIKNAAFGVYCIGNQVDTRCGSVKIANTHFEIDAAGYSAFFPTAVYWVDVEDGLTHGCTFKNYYSSVLNGNTGSGQGYGIYEGDGTSRSIKSMGDTFIYEDSEGRAAAGIYTSEALFCTIDSPTFDIQSGANVSALARLDAKRVDTGYVLKGFNANVAASVPCYGVYVVGLSTTRAPKIKLSDSIIAGGEHAFRVEGLGKGSYATANNDFSGQESTAGAVYYEGAAAVPHKNISMRGDRITGSQGPNVQFASYCLSPRLHGCELLDANLVGGAGDLRSNVLFGSTSQGCDFKGNTIGNTVSGGGLAVYGVTQGIASSSRIFKDITSRNTFIGIDNDLQWRRFITATPVHGLFDLSKGDAIENSMLGAGGVPEWRLVYALRPALTADASSASATISIEAGFASSIAAGMPVLLTKSNDPYSGDYADATKYHMDTVASVDVGANTITLTTGIDAGDGTYVAGTAKIVVGFFRPAAAIGA